MNIKQAFQVAHDKHQLKLARQALEEAEENIKERVKMQPQPVRQVKRKADPPRKRKKKQKKNNPSDKKGGLYKYFKPT